MAPKPNTDTSQSWLPNFLYFILIHQLLVSGIKLEGQEA
jgi:hypothetical protein